MKCRAKVIRYKKSGRVCFTINPDANPSQVEYAINSIPAKKLEALNLYADNGLLQECQGKIVGTIQAVEEPYYGGVSADLSVEFKCDTCGHSYYPNLPTKYNINDWINSFLEKIE
jgi:hypothetical protein